MQNKANLLDAQMNVTSFYTVDYENIANWKLDENKPNSKPIKANTKPIQTQFKPNSWKARMDVSLAITSNYNNEQRTMNNELLFKTKPIKPNFPKIPAHFSLLKSKLHLLKCESVGVGINFDLVAVGEFAG